MQLLKVHERRKVHWLVVGKRYRDIRQRDGAWASIPDYQLIMESNARRQRQFVKVKR